MKQVDFMWSQKWHNPQIHQPKEKMFFKDGWKAAFINMQQWIMGRRCDSEDILEYINKEIKDE